jgi:hypothetical protein
MRVETLYTDSSGTYRIRADIRENNRTAHIIDIIDNDYGTDADWDDFSEDEQATIHQLLLEEYDTLDMMNEDDYDGAVEEEDEDLSDY